KINRLVLPGSLRVQPERSTTDAEVLSNSIQSGPLSKAVWISFIRIIGAMGAEFGRAGDPFRSALACQLAGLPASPMGSLISREEPPPSAAFGQAEPSP